MKSLAEQLVEKGLASEEQIKNAQVARELKALADERPKLDDHFICIHFEGCQTVREFKEVAKNILLGNPSEINEIIQRAHAFCGDEGGKKKLIWFCYQVRDVLKRAPQSKTEQVLNRAFRRNGATFEIPEDWLR